MNHLVHLYLADPTDGCRLGALMGDYVKGRLGNRYAGEILRGLQQHRNIDRFAETNRYFQRSKRRFDPTLRHYRGILVDVAYDHLLALRWSEFVEVSLAEFATSIYRLLERHHRLLPPALQQAAPRMIAADWLVSCREKETVSKVLQRLAGRLSRDNRLAEGLQEIETHYRQLETDCRCFLQEALNHLHAQRRHFAQKPTNHLTFSPPLF